MRGEKEPRGRLPESERRRNVQGCKAAPAMAHPVAEILRIDQAEG
jgi:hypothetical protein